MSNDEKYSIVVPLSWTGETSNDLQSAIRCTGSFYVKSVNFLALYEEAMSCTGIIECIRNSAKYLAPYVNSENRAYIYLDFVFSLIEVFQSTNSIVIRNSLEEAIVIMLKHTEILTPHFEPPSLLSRFPVRDVRYNMVSGYVRKVTTDSFFYESYQLNYIDSMQTMLRYGVRLELEDEALRSYLMWMIPSLLMEIFLEEIDEELEEELKATIESNYATYSERRRLYFVLLAINVVLLKQKCSKYFKCFIESMKLVFKTINDPLITVMEISRFCDLTMTDAIEEDEIAEFSSLFLEEFPAAGAPFQPRPLQQLCRCRVRECLIRAKKLPHGVWSLKLPKLLQNYILLQKRKDEFYPAYMCDLKTKMTFMFGRRFSERSVLL